MLVVLAEPVVPLLAKAVGEIMTTRPAITATASVHDAATIMTARHFRHLPVTGGAGLLGLVDIIDVCQALINARQDD